MKNKIIPSITFFLIIFPFALLFYKSHFLDLSLVPEMVEDVWNIYLSVKPKKEVFNLSFPLPISGVGQKVTDEKLKSKEFEIFVDSSSDSSVVTWSSETAFTSKVNFSARLELDPIEFKKISPDYTVTYPKALKKYLKVPNLAEEDELALKNLASAILEGNEDKTEIVRKIYYYVEEEIQRKTRIKTIHETLNNGKGSPLVKAKIFNILCRQKGIPSRIVVAIRLPVKESSQEKEDNKLRFTYSNEVFLNNKWIPIDTNRGYFGKRPKKLFRYSSSL